MSSRLIFWFGWALLTVAVGSSEEQQVRVREEEQEEELQPGRRQLFKLIYRVDGYYNPTNALRTGVDCDLGSSEDRKCDVQIKIWIKCDGCEHDPPVYYPGQNSYFKNAQDISSSELGNKTLSAILDPAQGKAFFMMYVSDVDYTFGGPESIQRVRRIQSVSEVSDWVNTLWGFPYIHEGQLQRVIINVLRRVECGPSACGKFCYVSEHCNIKHVVLNIDVDDDYDEHFFSENNENFPSLINE